MTSGNVYDYAGGKCKKEKDKFKNFELIWRLGVCKQINDVPMEFDWPKVKEIRPQSLEVDGSD